MSAVTHLLSGFLEGCHSGDNCTPQKMKHTAPSACSGRWCWCFVGSRCITHGFACDLHSFLCEHRQRLVWHSPVLRQTVLIALVSTYTETKKTDWRTPGTPCLTHSDASFLSGTGCPNGKTDKGCGLILSCPFLTNYNSARLPSCWLLIKQEKGTGPQSLEAG